MFRGFKVPIWIFTRYSPILKMRLVFCIRWKETKNKALWNEYFLFYLTHISLVLLLYEKQSIELPCKPMTRFLCNDNTSLKVGGFGQSDDRFFFFFYFCEKIFCYTCSKNFLYHFKNQVVENVKLFIIQRKKFLLFFEKKLNPFEWKTFYVCVKKLVFH